MRLVTILLLVAGGLALAALPLTSAALLVAGGAVVIATLVKPDVALYLLAFAVPFGSLRAVSLGGMSLTATDVLVALLVVAWLMRGVLRRTITIAHAPLILPVLLVIVTQLLSLFDALSVSLVVKELVKWTEILAVYVIAGSILSEEGTLRAPTRVYVLISVLFAATLAEAVLGVYQFLFRVGPEWFLVGRFLRAYGTFAQPNPFAGYLNLTLPLGYALLLAKVERDGLLRRRFWTLGAVLLVVWLAVVGGALLMSFSRGAWLGLGVALLTITLLYSRRSALVMAGGGVLLAAILILGSANLLPSAITQRFTSVSDYFRVFDVRGVKVTDANFAVVERMAHWQAAWGMIQDRPWFGYGAGNYEVAYPRYSLAGWQEPLGHAHNVLLNVTAETGLVGLAAYVFFLAAALWMCWRAARAERGGGNDAPAFAYAIALGVMGVLLAKITHEMLDNLWVHSMGVQIAILLALPMHRHQPR
jgi:O-antigen ligase